MSELLTAKQMRAIEKAAIDSGVVTGLELMERAGRCVIEAIFEEWPELAQTQHRAVILCGPGNNGGDGFVVARLLKESGWEVEVFLYGDADKLPADAKLNCERWLELGGIRLLEKEKILFDPEPDVVIDAIFGTGLDRPLMGSALKIARELEERGTLWCDVAIDIPTGVNSDTGEILGAAIPAELTVTFHQEKHGHRIGAGSRYCGKVSVKDIGI